MQARTYQANQQIASAKSATEQRGDLNRRGDDAATAATAPGKPPAAIYVQPMGRRAEWKLWGLVMAVTLITFLLVQNRHWVPGGDSEFYTTVARNMAQGRGFTYNGQRVGIAPAGWPQVLAWAMRLDPSFVFLKLMTMSFMLGSVAMFYWVMRRFTSPAMTVLILLVCNILSNSIRLTFWLHSDALFCLFTTACLLLACQIGEGRKDYGRIAALLVVCVLAVFVRWAGLLGCGLAAALIFNRRALWPIVWDRKTLAAALVMVVTPLSFFVMRHRTGAVPVEQRVAMSDEAQTYSIASQPRGARTPRAYVNIYLLRVENTGNWLSWLFFEPLRLGSAGSKTQSSNAGASPAAATDAQLMPALGSDAGGPTARGPARGESDRAWARRLAREQAAREPADSALNEEVYNNAPGAPNRAKVVNAVANSVGWILIVFFLIGVVRGAMQRKWVWLATGAYLTILCIVWPHANARYIVPLAPLLLLGEIDGMSAASQWIARGFGRFPRRLLAGTFIAAVLLCNLPMYGVEVWVQRSSDFYDRYDGGLDRELIAAGQYLYDQHLHDDQLGVSERYTNLGRVKTSWFGSRVMSVLACSRIVIVPSRPPLGGEPTPELLAWCRQRGVKFYLYQAPISPWRIWHFRMAWLQEKMTGQPVIEESADWHLYEIPKDGPARPIELKPDPNWPAKVPGM